MTALDLAVVGGGPVGLALAAWAAASGLDVALVERAPGAPPTADDPRTLALAHGLGTRLAAVGGWPADAGAIERMWVRDRPGCAAIAFDAGDLAVPWLGHVMQVAVLRSALERALPATVARLVPAAPVALEDAGDRARLLLDDGRRLTARLVVAADGRGSAVRRLAGIAWHEQAYGERALVALIDTGEPHRRTARQVFLPDGPVALLPMADPHRSALVWSLPAGQARAWARGAPAWLVAELERAFEGTLGGVDWLGTRQAAALYRARAERYVAPRVALVGDAAHCMHPLAGQGANQGLLDAAALLAVVHSALARGRDPGAPATLRRYERWRRGEDELMARAMDGLRWLFAGQDRARRALRGPAVRAVGRCPPLRDWLARRASALAGDLPPPLAEPTP